MEKTRCAWAGSDPLYLSYHDDEWGMPQHDDRRLLELLILEGAQAGLSWMTILRKREHYRRAFAEFDPATVAAYDEERMQALLQDPGIVRNRRKIESAIQNARAFLRVQQEYGSFDATCGALSAVGPSRTTGSRWRRYPPRRSRRGR